MPILSAAIPPTPPSPIPMSSTPGSFSTDLAMQSGVPRGAGAVRPSISHEESRDGRSLPQTFNRV